jgi:hypothetical protein
MINFYCEKCLKAINYSDNERCKCEDLRDRYYKLYWGSSIFKEALEAAKR